MLETSDDVAAVSNGLAAGTPGSKEAVTCLSLENAVSPPDVVDDQMSDPSVEDGTSSVAAGVGEQVTGDRVTCAQSEGSTASAEGVEESVSAVPPTELVKEGSDDEFLRIRALCDKGKLKAALKLVDEEGLRLDVNSCGYLLKCAIQKKALAEGKRIREHITKCGLDLNTFLRNNVLRMYSECGQMELAREEFESMSRRTLFTWTTLITGYGANNQGKEALNVFHLMLGQGVQPDGQLLVTVLNIAAKLRSLDDGKCLHALIEEKGFEKNLFVLNSLIDMYGKCGDMNAACKVFEGMTTRDVVTWNAIIAGYAVNGQDEMAWEMYKQMGLQRVKPNAATFVCLLKGCTCPANLMFGKSVHQRVKECGLESNVVAGTAVMHMYVKCGSMDDARFVFKRLSKRDVVCWTAMITGCNRYGRYQESCELFKEMQIEGVKPNRFTYGAVMTALGKSGAVEEGRLVHEELKKKGLELDVATGINLVSMYATLGLMEEAREMFEKLPKRIAVTWVALIAGYLRVGNYDEPQPMYSRMLQEGMEPTGTAFVYLLNACVGPAALESGKWLEGEAMKALPQPSAAVQDAIANMYNRCGGSSENGANSSKTVMDTGTVQQSAGAPTTVGRWEYVATVRRSTETLTPCQ